MKPGLSRISLLLACALSAPACAFDCKAVRSPIEKTICADAGLQALDDKIGKAYGALRAMGDAGARAALAGSQRAWLVTRDGCLKEEKAKACLAGLMTRRLTYLTGRPEAGPGAAGHLVPLIRWRQAPSKAEQRIEAFVFASPATAGEKLFNELVRGVIDEWVADMSGQPQRETTLEVMASLPYASARFISLNLDSYSYAAGAPHPNRNVININVDLARGRALAFGDLFDAAAIPEVVSLCRRQLAPEEMERAMRAQEPDPLKEFDVLLGAFLPDLGAWSFTADHVRVTFMRRPLAGYLDGVYGCDLPYAALRPLARPGAWVID